MKNATQIKHVVLTGKDLTPEEVVAVARFGASVEISAEAKKRIRSCREIVEVIVEENIIAYGINTGFGALRGHIIPAEKVTQLQRNLIRSHACGVGDPFSTEVVRATILLRANALAIGNSGVRLEIVQALLDLLELGICPVVPTQGSVGASGDLAPLSHVALVLTGEPTGEFYLEHPTKQHDDNSRRHSSSAAILKSLGFTSRKLSYKEGLALNNGTQVMSAIAILCLYDTYSLLHNAEMATALSLEATKGVATALDPRLHAVRPLNYQGEVATRLRKYVEQSVALMSPLNSAIVQQVIRKVKKLSEDLTNGEIKKSLEDFQSQLRRLVQSEQQWFKNRDLHPCGVAHDQGSLERVQKKIKAIQENFHHICSEVCEEADWQDQHEWRQVEAELNQCVPSICPIQDDYSFRCSAQVISCTWRAWEHAKEIVTIEINAATDNPLIFPPEMPDDSGLSYKEWLRQNPEKCHQAVCSGGNFHGAPVGFVMDYLKIAISEIGSLVERSVASIVDANHNQGLPPFLTENPGLNSGFMIPQYTAAALVSECKVLCHPASVDSIPTSANSENHVSMATIAARHCQDVLSNVEKVVAICFLVSYQGIQFRMLSPGSLAREIQKYLTSLDIEYPHKIEEGLIFYREDRVWAPIIESLANAIRSRRWENLWAE